MGTKFWLQKKWKYEKEQEKSSGGRPTKEQAVLRDERVLRVATKAFIAQGFAATSLESIARLSRVALRTIYQQYGDKGGIFAAVIRRQLKHLSIFEFESDWESGRHSIE